MHHKSTPSLSNKHAKKAASIVVTLMFCVLAGGAAWWGTNLIADRANAVAVPQPTLAPFVLTDRIALKNHYTVSRTFTGQIEAPQSVSIAFETAGTVNAVFFHEGERVEKEQVLATLDNRLLKADLQRLKASKKALEAQREIAILTDRRQAQLREKGFASNQAADQSRLSVVETEARIAEVAAAILAAEIRLEKATVRAPFAGRVDQRMIDPGTTIGSGQSVLTLVEDDVPIFRVGIDPDLAGTLSVGKTVATILNELPVRAEVISILPKIDPVTRTRIVRLKLLEPVDLAFGQTGQLRIEQRITQSGAWIPLSAIEDGVRGLWTIKTAEGFEDPIVSVEAIEILHADEERAFVKGTFEANARLILSGLHRIAPGQRIRIAK